MIHKQQRPVQSQYGMLEAFMITSFSWYFPDLKQCLPTDFTENLLARKKIKVCYRILGTEILSYEEFHCKTVQVSGEDEWVICVHSFLKLCCKYCYYL